MEELQTQRILFLGEQDGLYERQLKEKLSAYFASTGGLVAAAYLVRVSYQETNHPFVALALIADSRRASEILERGHEIFASIFPATVSLDTIFLTRAMAAEVASVAKPFFGAPPPLDLKPAS